MSNASGVSCAPPAPAGSSHAIGPLQPSLSPPTDSRVPGTPTGSHTAHSLAERRACFPEARPPRGVSRFGTQGETAPDHAHADGPQSLVRSNRRLHLVTRMCASAARVSYGRLGRELLLDTAPGVQEKRGGPPQGRIRRPLSAIGRCGGCYASEARHRRLGGFCRP